MPLTVSAPRRNVHDSADIPQRIRRTHRLGHERFSLRHAGVTSYDGQTAPRHPPYETINPITSKVPHMGTEMDKW